jgi:hypothetical protein
MGASQWIGAHWFDLVQSIGIIASLLFSAYTTRKDERARRIGNLIAVNDEYRHIWREFYSQPGLSRVLKCDVDLSKAPVSDEEWLFVKMLILHLDTVRRAIKARMFVKIEGLREDVRDLFALPIPKAVWEKIKPFQDKDFVAFIEDCLAEK